MKIKISLIVVLCVGLANSTLFGSQDREREINDAYCKVYQRSTSRDIPYYLGAMTFGGALGVAAANGLSKNSYFVQRALGVLGGTGGWALCVYIRGKDRQIRAQKAVIDLLAGKIVEHRQKIHFLDKKISTLKEQNESAKQRDQ